MEVRSLGCARIHLTVNQSVFQREQPSRISFDWRTRQGLWFIIRCKSENLRCKMFLDDIHLVTEQIGKYGLRSPMVDLGGLAKPTIADYTITIRTGDQKARYLQLTNGARPFDHIEPNYLILNPETGDPGIEDLPLNYDEKFGTAVCLNVIEHVVNPFDIFNAIYQIMQRGGLVVISTVFSFPYHPSPRDYWRFSPDCLRMLGESVGFEVLEAEWRLKILADQGVKEIHTGEPQEIKSVYVTLRKPL